MKYQIKLVGEDEIFCERMKEFILAQYSHLFSFGADEESIKVQFTTKLGEEGIYCYQYGHRLVQEILWNQKEKDIFRGRYERNTGEKQTFERQRG